MQSWSRGEELTVGLRLQPLDVLPRVRVPREDPARPRLRSVLHVVLNLLARLLLELCAENGVGEADVDADLVVLEERVVAVVEVGRTVAEDRSVESDDDSLVARVLGSLEEGDGDGVVGAVGPIDCRGCEESVSGLSWG